MNHGCGFGDDQKGTHDHDHRHSITKTDPAFFERWGEGGLDLQKRVTGVLACKSHKSEAPARHDNRVHKLAPANTAMAILKIRILLP